jgi:hypothetical protein
MADETVVVDETKTGDEVKTEEVKTTEVKTEEVKTEEVKTPDDAKGVKKTLATGGEAEVKVDEPKGYWPDDWRQKLAENIAAGDKKVYDKELKRLQRISDPSGVYGMYRELEGKFDGGGLVKVPGKDAKPEETEAFRKAMGIPEKPEGFLEGVQLSDGAVIGADDKPRVNAFLEAVHTASTPQEFVNKALDWYFKGQEQAAAELDTQDDAFRNTSERTLKEEFGPSFKRVAGAIPVLFQAAPGGSDASNPNSLYARLVGGRTADGRIIGDDPDMMRWLMSMASELHPIETVVEGGAGGIRSAETRLDELRKLRVTDPRKYWADETQAEELKLLDAIQKQKARAA